LGSAEGFECPEPSSDKSKLVITYIRADHVTFGVGQAPTECYVLVQFDGTKRRTRSKPVGLEKATEWKELIPLPSELSAILRLSVCASSEFASRVAEDETLHTLELSVADLLDHSERGQLIRFSPKEGDVVPSLPSLLVATERRNCNDLDNSVSVMTPKHS
jgi:hypothetical protein